MTAPTTDAPNDDETAGDGGDVAQLQQPAAGAREPEPEQAPKPEHIPVEDQIVRYIEDFLRRLIWEPLRPKWEANRPTILGALRIIGYILVAFIVGLVGGAIGAHGLGTAEFWKVAAAPFATIGAGLLAIGAATIAFFGVRYAQKVAISTAKATLRQQATAQIRQAKQHTALLKQQRKAQARQAAQHAEQMRVTKDVERDKHRRQVTFETLVDVNKALMELRTAFLGLDEAVEKDTLREAKQVELANWLKAPTAGVGPTIPAEALGPAVSECNRLADSCTGAASMLLVLGIRDAYDDVMAVVTVVRYRLADEINYLGELNEQGFMSAYNRAVASLAGAMKGNDD